MSEKFPSSPSTPETGQQPEKHPLAVMPMQEELLVEAIGGQHIDNYSMYFAEKFGDTIADSLAKYGGYGAIRPVGEWSRHDGKTIRIEMSDEDISNYLAGKLNVAKRVKDIVFPDGI